MNAVSFQSRSQDIARGLASKPLVRAVNFHNTPRSRVPELERQLAHWARHFTSVSEDDLDGYLQTGRWPKSRPGLIVALYEGYRNHHDVMLPLLEKHGLNGWLFVITGFVGAPIPEQRSFAERHDISLVNDEYPDGRYALNWEELRSVDGRHVIASHARTHTPLRSHDASGIESEVIGSQRDLTAGLGHPVRTFVSYSGPPYGEHPESDRRITEAGYQFVFSNFRIQRLRAWAP